jgi:YhcH/YjgK/YiaL family protein
MMSAMITDLLLRAETYVNLSPGIRQAFEFLRRPDLTVLPPGTYEIDGRRVFALVQEYQSKPADAGRWEAHRRYIDLQYVVSGRERFGFAAVGRMPAAAYDDEKDIERPQGEGVFLDLRAGEFVLAWPGEVHMPGMAAGEPAPVRKIVVKIQA